MMNLTMNEVLQVLDGTLVTTGRDEKIRGISIDSRTLNPGELFFGLKGEKTDGARFTKDVKKKGGTGMVVERVYRGSGRLKNFWTIRVRNSTDALGSLAKYYRLKFPATAIGITGSNGKTTTKELTARILETRYRVLKSESNFNNEIGLPLTIFKLKKSTEIMVLEMGLNHHGELSRLASIAEPDFGLITNTGFTHLEFLKNIRGVAKAKSEIIPFVKKTIVLNREDRFFNFYRRKVSAKDSVKSVVTFGISKGDYRPDFIKNSGPGFSTLDETLIRIGFPIKTTGKKNRRAVKSSTNILYNSIGNCNISNLMAAIALAGQFKRIKAKDIKSAVESFKSIDGRLKIYERKRFRLIDDSYNSNPTSLLEAAGILAELNGRKFIILGGMKELGKLTEKLHFKIGISLSSFLIDYFYTTGYDAYHIFHGLKRKRKENIYHFKKKEALIRNLKSKLMENGGRFKRYRHDKDTVLIKGSRKNRMEEVVQALLF